MEEQITIDDIIAATETTGGIGTEVEVEVDNIDLVEDGDSNE